MITVRPFHPIAMLMLASCIQISTGSPDGGTSGTQSSGTTVAAKDGASSNTGADCVDFGSGVVLCTSISLCPSIAVDHDLYPNCGFRIPGNSIDLECVCDNALCPVGSALSCTQARNLLDSQAEVIVCAQAAEGRCAALSVRNSVSSCNQSCAADCVGDPACLKLCGC
jgi:hypothetical protein